MLEKLFTPPTRLMARLRTWQKFVLVAAVLLIPLAWVGVAYLSDRTDSIGFATSEQSGLAVARPAVASYLDLLALRQAAVSGAAGEPGAQASLPGARAALTASLAKVQSAVQSQGDLNLTEPWATARRAAETAAAAPAADPAVVNRTLDRAVDEYKAFLGEVDNRSNLALDPDLDSYYLQDSLLTKLPAVAAGADQAAHMTVLRRRGRNTMANTREATLGVGEAQSVAGGLESNYATAFSSSADAGLKPALQAKLDAFIAGQVAVDRAATTMNAAAAQAGIARLLAAGRALAATTADKAGAIIAAREDKIRGDLRTTLIITALALLAALYLFVGFYLQTRGAATAVVERLRRLRERETAALSAGLEGAARGDYTIAAAADPEPIVRESRDEIGDLADEAERVRAATATSIEAYEQVRGTLGEALGPHSCLVPLTERLESLTNRCMAGLEGALERIAAGDLTVEVTPVTTPVASESGEPVGHLAEVFNSLLDRTQNAVGSYGDMRVKVREMLGEISSTSQTVAAASQQMASTSEEAGKAVGEIATAVGEVATGAERQVRSVEAAREATQEMAGAAQQSAASAEQTATAAKQARAVAEEGAAAVAEATEAMSAVRESSQEATTAIRELGDKSEQIGGIVDTISGIAEQTNLLALNAAIEAARAGEQGRGFAVVAEEVRKLAEESQDAAASIARLIEEITAQTSRAVEVVEKGGQQTHDGSATVERARESFLAIQGAVDDMNGRIEDIAASVQQIASSSAKMETDMGEVAAVAEQSSASSEQVSASTEQTSASTQEIASSAQQLAGTAEELERLVGQFQLEPA
ncbi:MAG: methyl-accepting chemotaxis protein [Solirubrobacteraceae bacterium]